MNILNKEKYKGSIQNITLFFALLISFWIPQYRFILSLFIALWFVFSVLQFNYKQHFIENYSQKKFVLFILQIIFFFVIVLGYIISESKNEALDIIVKKLSFLVFPILFILSNKKFAEKKDVFLKLFVFGNIVTSIICLSYALYQSINFNENVLIFNTINEEGYSYFLYSRLSILHHPTYLSMYLVFSIAILFYFKKRTSSFDTLKRKILFNVLILFLFIIIFLLSSRAGIFTSLLLFVWRIILFLKNNKKPWIILISVFAIIVSIIVLSQNSRINKTYTVIKKTFSDGREYKYYPARLILWESATEVIAENFWLGAGTGDVKSKISDKSSKYIYKYKTLTNLNAHNQYLETFMSSGLIGFFLLVIIIGYSFYTAIKSKDGLFIFFLLLIMFNFIFESMLNTIAGIVFGLFFLNYFIFVHSVPDENKLD